MSEKTFTISGQEFPIRLPKGKKGRKATNYLLTQLGEGESAGAFFALLDDDKFEAHLPTILGLDASFLEEEGTTAELVTALVTVVSELFEGVKAPEVQAALKNSEGGQAEEG